MAGNGRRFPTRFFYRDEYVYDVLEAGARHTFDIEQPRRIRNELVATGVAGAEEFFPPEAVTEQELLLVHTPEYLDYIRRPENLARLLFLDAEHPWDESLLQPFLYATGGTVDAARVAAVERLIAINLGGGFHHALADKAQGFCALADVAVAVRALQRDQLVERVIIVDLDYHHGNGNAEIFATDETVFTFSIHAGNWSWITKQNNCDIELPAGTDDDGYLQPLRANLLPILNEFQPDFAVYLAGSDPFIEDKLGDFRLTEAGMLERDSLVTGELWCRDIPFAVVTAGGYGEQSWRVHFNYFRWLLSCGAGA